MKQFKVDFIIDNEDLENRLDQLAKRCEKLNGWKDHDLMQFAVNAMPLANVYIEFLDLKIEELEQTENIKRLINKMKKEGPHG